MNKQQTSVGHIEIKATEFNAEVDLEHLPVLPTRNLVLYPGVVYPITLVRESSRQLAEWAADHNVAIAVVCQKNATVDHPSLSSLEEMGVLAQVLKVLPLPDDTTIAVVMTNQKVRLLGPAEKDTTLLARAEIVREPRTQMTERLRNVLDRCRELLGKLMEQTGGGPSMFHMEESGEGGGSPAMILGSMCINAPLPQDMRMKLLETNGLRERANKFLGMLTEQVELTKLSAEIEERARRKMSERQRNAFLETQMEEIRTELYGDDDSEVRKFRERLEEIAPALTEESATQLRREVAKLERLNPQSPDYQVQFGYLQTVMDLPWTTYTDDNTDFDRAEADLNATHSGLQKVKDRILEQLAVLIQSKGRNVPIICLVGPPGVGKTSLGQSIARAMGRKFQRVSLGGVHDEAEIRGHRRTYIGAMPGRIIDAIRRAASANPIIMLDEIDKLGRDYKGDPSSALLEVLDPEQNVKFHDNFVDLDFDLSRAMFITTANTLSTVPAPLLDRMEIIQLSGYTTQEKLEIAREHLLPVLDEKMMPDKPLQITDGAIEAIIDNYTSESGVRQLQKQLASVERKYIRSLVGKKPFKQPVEADDLRELLGVPTNSRDHYGTQGQPGVATGLAWTAAGGEVLFIETVLIDGKGQSQLTLTGNLGDVMKESATMAHRYVLAHGAELGIKPEALARDLHIHVPEGAIPKDGPSAGITITTAIVSAMTGRPLRPHVAMTGEMTLRGKVLPVGGIKEKLLAAKRAGVKEIYMCADNRAHFEEINPKYVEGLDIHFVTSASEVLEGALEQ